MNKFFLLCAKKVFALLLLIALASCEINDECINPGDGFSMMNKKIVVSSDQVEWLDTGFDIEEDQKMEMSVTGSINYCANANDSGIFQVPAAKCIAGDIDFGSSTNQKDNWSIITYEGSIESFCSNKGGVDQNRPKISTGIRVSTGDLLSVAIVPEERELTDCYSAASNGFSIDESEYDANSSGNTKIPAEVVCQNGGIVFVGGTEIELAPLANRTYKRFFTNHPGSKGNKVGFNIGGILGDGGIEISNAENDNRNFWFYGAFADLRIFDEKPSLNAFDCNKGLTSNQLQYSKYESSELARHCNFLSDKDVNSIFIFGQDGDIGSSGSGLWSGLIRNIAEHDMEIEGQNNIVVEVPVLDKDGAVHEILSNLVVSIDGEILKYDMRADGFDRTLDYATYNKKLTKIEGNISNKEVSLYINENTSAETKHSVGGLTVEVERQCPRSDGETLYMYIGNSVDLAGINPGDEGTIHIDDVSKNKGNIYIINKDNAPKAGRIFLAVKQPVGTNGSEGKYDAVIAAKIFKPLISKPFAWLEGIVLDLLRGPENDDGVRDSGVMRTLYEGILNKDFKDAIYIVIAIYISFVSLGFLMGVIQVSGNELIVRVIKIGIVATLISDASWSFFYKYLFEFYLDTARYLINIFAGRYETTTSFAFLDPTLGALLTSETLIRMLAMLMAGPIGWMYFGLMVLATMEFISAVGIGIMLYLMSLIAVSFLVSIFPIFLSFSLFQQTKRLFEVWVRQLSVFVSQPIFLFASIGMLNQIARMTIYNALNFGACKSCLVPVYIMPPIPEFCLITFFTPTGFGDYHYEDRVAMEIANTDGRPFFGMPVHIHFAVHIFIVMYCMKVFSHVSLEMPKGIFASVFGGLSSAAMSGSEGFKSLFGMDRESKARRKSSKYIDIKDVLSKKKAQDGSISRQQGVGSASDSITDSSTKGRSASDSITDLSTEGRSASDTIVDPNSAAAQAEDGGDVVAGTSFAAQAGDGEGVVAGTSFAAQAGDGEGVVADTREPASKPAEGAANIDVEDSLSDRNLDSADQTEANSDSEDSDSRRQKIAERTPTGVIISDSPDYDYDGSMPDNYENYKRAGSSIHGDEVFVQPENEDLITEELGPRLDFEEDYDDVEELDVDHKGYISDWDFVRKTKDDENDK